MDLELHFSRFAQRAAQVAGSPWAFVLALALVLPWLLTGPLFGFSNTWQLVFNTGANIVEVLKTFLIQNTQRRNSRAAHLKLDELIRAVAPARTQLVNLEEMSDEDLAQLEEEFRRLHAQEDARRHAAHAHLGPVEEAPPTPPETVEQEDHSGDSNWAQPR